MAIVFNCPCGKQLRAPEECAGRPSRCPTCGCVVTIPSSADGQTLDAVLTPLPEAVPTQAANVAEPPGSPAPETGSTVAAPEIPVNLPIASLVFGAVSFCLPLVAAAPAILCGALALRAVRRQGGPPRARLAAFVGMGLSALSTGLALLALLVLGVSSMFANRPSGGATTAAGATHPASTAAVGSDSSWKVLFRSADPSIWNDDINKGPDHFAMSVNLAPGNTRYLRFLDARSKDFVIIEMTKERLNQMTDDGKYGWEGTNEFNSAGHHLGIYHKIWPAKGGEVCVCSRPHTTGWGFGHGHFVNDTQRYAWAGKTIEKTVFEIAVKAEPLTDAEAKKLLKKGNARE